MEAQVTLLLVPSFGCLPVLRWSSEHPRPVRPRLCRRPRRQVRGSGPDSVRGCQCAQAIAHPHMLFAIGRVKLVAPLTLTNDAL